MKKSMTSLLIIFCVMVGAVSANAEGRKLKIGVIAPLEGAVTVDAESLRYAEELARKDHEDEQEAVEVVYKDSGSIGALAVAAYEALAKNDVDVIFAIGDNTAALLAPLAEKSSVPLFYLGSHLSLSEGKSYVALFDNDKNEFGRALWDELRRQKKHTVALVQNPSPRLNSLVQGIVANALVDERATVEINEPELARDFGARIKALKKKQFDVLGVFMAPTSAHAFLHQAQQAGVSTFLVGDEQLIPSDRNSDLEGYLKDSVLLLPRVTDEFQQRYYDKFESYQGMITAARFYDFFSLVATTFYENEDSLTTREALLSALRFENEQIGASGPFCVKTTAKKGTYYSFPIALYKREGSKLVVSRLFERPS